MTFPDDQHSVSALGAGGAHEAFRIGVRFAEAGVTDLICQFQVGGLASQHMACTMG